MLSETLRRSAVIIEDDDDVRDLLHAVLIQSAFTVHTAPGGLAGVEIVRRINPDLVTLDVGLPDIDGFEVARRIRAFSETFIVMLTARAEPADRVAGLSAGADEYMTKPFSPADFRRRIDEGLVAKTKQSSSN